MRQRLIQTLLAAVLLFSLSTQQAYAWHSVGHMAVAYVAYQQLTPKTRARVAVLLKQNPYYKTWVGYLPNGVSAADRDMYLFMMAATWPDEIKAHDSGYNGGGPGGGDTPPKDPKRAARNTGYDDKDMHKYWHFTTHPFSTDGSVLPTVPVPNSATEVALFRTTIRKKTTLSIESYDLVWLEHLVGDIHQPLHDVTRVSTASGKTGDAGGNKVVVKGPGDLHSYWDELPGSGDTTDFLKALTYAQTLPTPDAAAVTDTDIDHWETESINLAETFVYSGPIGPALGPYTLDDAYKAKAQDIAKQRVALAGARLAKLLNDNLK